MRIRYQLALAIAIITILVQVVRAGYYLILSMGEKSICPRCGALYLNQSSRRGLADFIYRAFGCLPYRCSVCELRFHRPRVHPNTPSRSSEYTVKW
jgi:hypothetical protein